MTREMKYSGVEWIGDIPSDWKVKPISTCFMERNEKVSDYDWEALSVTKQGIVKQLKTAAKSDAHDARKKVCVGDFVINSRSDRKQSCGVSDYDGSVSLINIVLRHNELLCSDYIKFALKNYGFAEEFYRWGTGIVDDLWSTNYQRMKKIMIPVPHLSEQKKIADFLDSKISEIDKIIAETKSSIENYKEYKQAVITEAVTKGLDKNVPMKDSGIEWIGEIPNGWKVQPLKNIIKVRNEKTINTQNYIGMENVESKTGKAINQGSVQAENEALLIKKGDVLFGKLRPYLAKVYYVETDGCCSTEFMVSIPELIVGQFLKYLYLTNGFIQTINMTTYGTKMPRANTEFIKNLKVVLPTYNEQRKIAISLDHKCTEIDKLVSEKEKLIANLEEYKKSLIYEYVTGKKEVK